MNFTAICFIYLFIYLFVCLCICCPGMVWLERGRLLESESSLQHVYAAETKYDMMIKSNCISQYYQESITRSLQLP